MKDAFYVIIGFIIVLLIGALGLVTIPVFIAGLILFIIVTFVITCIASAIIVTVEHFKCGIGYHVIEDDDIIYIDGNQYAFCQNCNHWVKYNYDKHKWAECDEKEVTNGRLHIKTNSGSKEV